MLKSLAISYTALKGFQQMLEVTAHNLANLNTTAYREKMPSFSDLTYRELAERRLPVAGEPPSPPLSGRGSVLSAVTPSAEPGPLHYTGLYLDLAVVGEGFFRVIRPDGSLAYTRDGNFRLDREGNLVTPGGARLEPYLNLSAKEHLDPFTLVITPGGQILASPLPGAATEGDEFIPGEGDGMPGVSPGPVLLGQIYLYRFANPESLIHVGENLLMPSASSAPPEEGTPGEGGFGEVRQGFLEGSGVDLSRQVDLIIRGQRGLMASSRAAYTADELWALTLGLKR